MYVVTRKRSLLGFYHDAEIDDSKIWRDSKDLKLRRRLFKIYRFLGLVSLQSLRRDKKNPGKFSNTKIRKKYDFDDNFKDKIRLLAINNDVKLSTRFIFSFSSNWLALLIADWLKSSRSLFVVSLILLPFQISSTISDF